jgi:H+/Cl- antiporter ClcA
VNLVGDWLRGIFDFRASGDLIVYSAVIGVVSGLGAWVSAALLRLATSLVLNSVVGYYPPDAGSHGAGHPQSLDIVWWAVLLVPAVGGLICGWIVYTFAPEAEGHGTDAMVKAFHRLLGSIRGRVPIVKGIASIITICSGGSAGREGPIAQIGAGFGSFLATSMRLSSSQRPYLMLAGAAGGIAAIFQAPLGGALLVCEALYATTAVEFAAVIPAVVSEKRMVGIFSLHDIRMSLEGNGPSSDLILAADIATFPVITVTPDDDLHTALWRFTEKNIEDLPVVDRNEPRRVLGMLRRKDLTAAYHEQMAALRLKQDERKS